MVAAFVLWVFWTYGRDLPDYHNLQQNHDRIHLRALFAIYFPFAMIEQLL